jgi:hypothetical protein
VAGSRSCEQHVLLSIVSSAFVKLLSHLIWHIAEEAVLTEVIAAEQ